MGQHVFDWTPELKIVLRPSDEPQWYALRVQPQKEYIVAYMLRQRGVRTFVATETKFRRRTRYTKSKAEFAHPEIPGCVFAGFDGVPAWYYILKNQLIVGAEGHGGVPWRFDAAKLHRFFASAMDGCMVIDDGMRLVSVGGRLIRSPTTQVRAISKRKRTDDVVIEATGRRARLLAQFVVDAPKQLASAA